MIYLLKKLLLKRDNSKKFDARVWIQLALLNKNLKLNTNNNLRTCTTSKNDIINNISNKNIISINRKQKR